MEREQTITNQTAIYHALLPLSICYKKEKKISEKPLSATECRNIQ